MRLIGKEPESNVFLDLMGQSQLKTSLIVRSTTRPTTIKTRVIAHDQQILRLDKETKDDLTEEETSALLKKLETHFHKNKVTLCILQDYNKGVLTKEVISSILSLAKKYKVLVSVDPKFNNFWEYKGVQLFKPNLKEIQNALPFPIDGCMDSLKKAAAYIKQQLNNDVLLVTLSENGAFISSENGSTIYPTSKRQVADVCGAGDAVISIASLAMCIGLEEKEMALLSNLAGGQVVEKVGVVPIDKGQLVAEVEKIQVS